MYILIKYHDIGLLAKPVLLRNRLYVIISKAHCIMEQSVFHLAYQRLELEVFISSSCLVNTLPELEKKLK